MKRYDPERLVLSGARGASRRANIPPFQTFLEDNRAIVYRFLRAAIGPQAAEDCFQETFLAALRAYSSLSDGANLRGWVLTIATRKAIDAGRAAQRRATTVSDIADVADGHRSQEHEPGRLDPQDPLWRAVRSLPPRQRAAIVHRYVLDRSYAEVAGAMGSSEDTARANVYQGLKKLREGLNHEDQDE